MKIQIDKDIPMIVKEKTIEPCKRTGKRGRPPLFPFEDMEIGDSIFIPGPIGKIRSATSSSQSYAAKNGVKFSTHRTMLNGVKGVRIWRIA